MDHINYVNVFQGTGEIDLPKPRGIAAKWFFLKAGCGNTSPAALAPFGAMSAAPYSGGYPTGYTDHMPNSHSRPPKFEGGDKLLGFAHLQQSGTGSIGYYYNYAVTVPRYDASAERRPMADETASPGYYAVTLEDIRCELTAAPRCACHRYTFGSPGGYLTIDFSNNGVNIPNWGRADAHIKSVKNSDPFTVLAETEIEGVKICFAAVCSVRLTATEKGAVSEKLSENGVIELNVSVSTVDTARALSLITDKSFDETKAETAALWEQALKRVSIETKDEKIKEIFYSNLYHSLVKPADWTGDSIFYEGGGPFVADLGTLWDMYKTALPLIFAVYRDMGEKTVETLLRCQEAKGRMPNCIGLTSDYDICGNQARALGVYTLLTAASYGYPIDPKRLIKVMENDLFNAQNDDFCQGKPLPSNTFLLDLADAFSLAADYAEAHGDPAAAARLKAYAPRWRDAFDEKTGILKNDTGYYEGSPENYSFRQMADMDARIALAGGKERFIQLMDRFFGYGAPDVVQPTDPHNFAPVQEGQKLGRFEGFNNESDTEAPYSYIYAGRHDRTCEIVRGGMKYMFTDGRGGLPGNNDSGALSSYYVMAALGLFPVAGQDLFLIGSPFIDAAELSLYNGNTLKIRVKGASDENIYVAAVRFNGNPVTDFKMKASDLLKGGELTFEMTDRPQY
ncbi:MAG: glycoside hydrolase family 92 protein [Clostridia bacterium]|nr:glycoside hydrolase family 92 protein [Clostridia bacterium]